MMRAFSKASAIVLAIGLSACGQGGTEPEHKTEAHPDNRASDHSRRSDMKMHESMAAAIGADVSDTWVRKMIAHHEGAIAMTDAVLVRGGDPRVAAIARRIGAQQRREIEEMRGLLRKDAATDPASARPYAAGEKRMHDSMMAVQGGDEPQAFLRRMIPHHQGAIDMSRIVLEQGGDARVTAIARRIVADQGREIAEMKALLAGEA